MARGAPERYARALLEISLEEKSSEKRGQELVEFSDFLQKSQDLKNVLFKKIFSPTEKKEVMRKLFEHITLSKTSQNFLCYLIDQGKFEFFFEIIKKFNHMLDEVSRVVEVEVFSASPLARSSQKKMDEQLEKWIGKKTRVIYKVDANVIGGVITKIGNHIYDGSVKTELHVLEQRLLEG